MESESAALVPPPPPRAGALRSMVRALAHRNFRLFFAGQSVSLIGTWMQQVAMAWLIYRQTGSAYWLGIVGFTSQVPSFFLAPVAGVLVDRWPKHRVVIATQTLAMLHAFLLAGLTLAGTINVWQIILLSIFLGLVTAFDITARQAFMREMVADKEDLANAIALNSSMVNGARLIGPSIAGLLIAATSEGVCFLLNGLSYVAVLAALLAMKVEARERGARSRLLADLREGVGYTFGFGPIRSILLLLALVCLAGMPYMTLMPIFATEVLHGGPDTLGFLMGASGVGALGAAIFLASRRSVLGLGKWIALAPTLFGLGLIGFAFSDRLWLSLLLLLVAGFAVMMQSTASNTVLQTIVEEDKRGRVMSFYTMAYMGMTPLGSLLAGFLASTRLGAPGTLVLGGLSCIAGSLVFASGLATLRARVRPIYARMGILPEIAVGMQAATNLLRPPQD